MIDSETSWMGVLALGTAIGEVMEDVVDLALRRGPDDGQAERMAALARAGRDIEVLAKAMAVLQERAVEGGGPA
jgi:hypothetical protein